MPLLSITNPTIRSGSLQNLRAIRPFSVTMKGVLDPHHVPQPYTEIDVLGKTPGEVADIIMNNISDGSTTGRGSVIVLCGLSGTGKVRINANVHLKLGRKNLK
jgi:adenylylsulfate kinase-like enzyme